MESKVKHIIIMALLAAQTAGADSNEVPWATLQNGAESIRLAHRADSQVAAVGVYVADVWKLRTQKVRLKVILCDKQGTQINWSKPDFSAESVAAIVVIPQNTDGRLKPFVVIPLGAPVVYAFIQDF